VIVELNQHLRGIPGFFLDAGVSAGVIDGAGGAGAM